MLKLPQSSDEIAEISLNFFANESGRARIPIPLPKCNMQQLHLEWEKSDPPVKDSDNGPNRSNHFVLILSTPTHPELRIQILVDKSRFNVRFSGNHLISVSLKQRLKGAFTVFLKANSLSGDLYFDV